MLEKFAIVLGVVARAAVAGGAYDVTAWSFPSGGATAANGAFRVIGTVGEPLAGSCSGGPFELCHGFWWVVAQGGALTPIDPETPGGPDGPQVSALAVGFPAPNPTSGAIVATVALPSSKLVERVLYDVAGRERARIEHGMLAAGVHRLRWDLPTGPRGLPAGVYFETVLLDHRAFARRSVVLAP